MSNERGPLREVSWRDVFPWIIIFRAFRISVAAHVLILASLGATATTVGWLVSDVLFVREDSHGKDLEFMAVVQANNQWPWHSHAKPAAAPGEGGALGGVSSRVAGIPDYYAQRFVEPFRNVLRVDITLVKSAYFLFGGLWSLAVWAFVGAAITRIAVMRLGCEERVGLKEALGHACRRFGAYVAAPAMPLIAVAVLAVPLVLLGLLMKLDVGVAIAGFVWLLVVLDGLVMSALLIGLMFGWPLMWGAISSEGSDSFDALSRSYNYTFQRPLHYLFYVLVASLFGVLCYFLVDLFAHMVVNLGYWGISWGSGNERAFEIFGMAELGAEREGVAGFGTSVISVFTGLVRLLVGGFTYAFFWCVTSAIYLLLRYNVDQTEFDEIWLEEHEQHYELPELKPDESGVPQLNKGESDDEPEGEKPESDAGAAGDHATEPQSEAEESLQEETQASTADAPDGTGESSSETSNDSEAENSGQDETKPSSG